MQSLHPEWPQLKLTGFNIVKKLQQEIKFCYASEFNEFALHKRSLQEKVTKLFNVTHQVPQRNLSSSSTKKLQLKAVWNWLILTFDKFSRQSEQGRSGNNLLREQKCCE